MRYVQIEVYYDYDEDEEVKLFQVVDINTKEIIQDGFNSRYSATKWAEKVGNDFMIQSEK